MKRFRGFLIKEFRHIFRDRRTLLILFGMPVVQILLFGFAITNEIKHVRIAILDHSRDRVTRDITARLLASGYFRLELVLENEDGLERAFREGRIKEAVVFEPRFGEKLRKTGSARMQLLADASDPNTANTVVSYTRAIIGRYQAEMNDPGPGPEAIATEVRLLYNPELKGVFLFVPGLITIILMLVSAMMTSISITREKELGTLEVLMVSPLRPFSVLTGKAMPYLLLSLANTVVILLLGYFVFRVPLTGSLLLLMAECLLFIITALSLGILISTITQSQQTAMMISMAGLMLPTIMLSGFMFPVESMPWPLRWLSQVIPARWFIVIIKGIMLKGAGIQLVWKETLILGSMSLAFILLSLRKFKMRTLDV